MNKLQSFTVGILLFCVPAFSEVKQAVEIGEVQWGRDLEGALRQSTRSGKPVLALFQEVPGCAGCQKFGKNVLSHDLLVEAIETEFIPILVYNNQAEDKHLLKRFGEPAWNYQVIRFLDGKGRDIIPRKDKVWSIGGVARRMGEALKQAGRPTPGYLSGLALAHDNPHLATTEFSMFCFWTGEMHIGAVDGVIRTEAGFNNGKEVTRVWYDRSKVSLPDLAKTASTAKCANTVLTGDAAERKTLSELRFKTEVPRAYRKAPVSDQKKQLSGTAFGRLDLTPWQRTKVNAFARRDRQKALSYLSPRQIEQLKKP
ncbi:MAG: VPGUxxT family thioredoxin-like (seleno)protein, type 2 [Verrucomicrobiota bacterium]